MAERRALRQTAYVLQACALGLFLLFCRLLPVDWASAMGGWLGRTIGPRLGQSRKAARNLIRAMPENSPDENQRIVRGMWDNLGRVIAEYPHLPRICAQLEGGRVEFVGYEHIRGMAEDGKPGIVFGAHLGNWEVPSFAARHFGFNMALVYRAPNNAWVDRLLHRLRDSPLMIPKGREGARALFSLLRNGGHAAFLVDQKMNDGIAVPFFGRDAMTAPAIAQFGFRLGCVIVPFRTERLKGAHFRITVFPPMELIPTGDRAADEQAVMARINAMVEGWIRAAPEQWLWLHRRWPD
jgi:KDO2-lipid IV(A) lauroyltransferase